MSLNQNSMHKKHQPNDNNHQMKRSRPATLNRQPSPPDNRTIIRKKLPPSTQKPQNQKESENLKYRVNPNNRVQNQKNVPNQPRNNSSNFTKNQKNVPNQLRNNSTNFPKNNTSLAPQNSSSIPPQKNSSIPPKNTLPIEPPEEEFNEPPQPDEIPKERESVFRVLREKAKILVDKSMLIKEFIESEAKIVSVFYPKKFGKSCNLDMIRSFVKLENDEKGQIIESKVLPKYFLGGDVQLNENETKTFESMEISTQKEIIAEKMGRFPTIYVNFKISKGSINQVKNNFKISILEAFREHLYLENSPQLSLDDKKLFSEYHVKMRSPNFSETRMNVSLRFLSKCLRLHWNEKVFIFIDEFDSPITDILYSNGDIKAKNDFILLFSQVFANLLKNNDNNVEKALLTGVLQIDLPELNNIITTSGCQPLFTEGYYGFTEEDVVSLFEKHNINKEKFLNPIKQWYKGYSFGKKIIFNPFSIQSCLSDIENNIDNCMKSFWPSTVQFENLDRLMRFLDIQNNVKKLLSGESLEIKPKIPIRKEDFQRFIEISRQKSNNFEETPKGISDVFFGCLLYSGYLTLDGEKLQIPNLEIKKEFQECLIKYFKDAFEIKFEPAANLLNKIIDPENRNRKTMEKLVFGFCDEFNVIISKIPEFLGIKGRKSKEDVIHTLVNVIGLHMPKSLLGSEVFCQKGVRCEIAVVQKRENGSIGVIIGVKFKDKAITALNQVIDRKYQQILPELKSVVCVGIKVSKIKKTTAKFFLNGEKL